MVIVSIVLLLYLIVAVACDPCPPVIFTHALKTYFFVPDAGGTGMKYGLLVSVGVAAVM
ncbi:hypothetical protein SDC9_169763 [bioreactor metagenome]|uniref:Uncharacterized protein n=1 Tax=bioreactor metagenome TaxID=1076179 RepID=A0A645G8Q3_9ZZZZ